MKEIVTIQLGNCGNALGCKFWEEICQEHGLESTGIWCSCTGHQLQLEKINALFSAGTRHNYVPRCVLIDLDPSSLESCRCSPIGQLFRPDNFVFGRVGSGNNFARARFTEGVDIRDMTSETIRKEVELCDGMVGFQMLHAVGGGTGAGMGALLLEMLKDEYPKSVLMNYTVIPSPKVSDSVVEPLNATLACPPLIKHSDITVCLDNECLYEICHNTLKLESPLYDDLNQVIAKVMTGMSAAYRFPATSHMGWREMSCVMVPSPKLHFFVPAFAPLNSRGVQAYRTFSVQDVTYQLLHGKIFMGNIPKDSGKYITATALYRGFCVPDDAVFEQLINFQYKYESQFVDWMPYHFLKGVCETPPKGMKTSATFLANHTGSVGMWGRVLSRYKKMFKRKAFIHWFYDEGMSQDDFTHAETEINDLIQEYKDCEVKPPPGWVSPDINEGLHKCLDEERILKIIEIVKPVMETKYIAC